MAGLFEIPPFSWYGVSGGGTEKIATSGSDNPKEVTDEANCDSVVAGVLGVPGELRVEKTVYSSRSEASDESKSEFTGRKENLLT